MQFAAQARLEGAIAGIEGGVGGDGRRVLRMEVTPPVHVVAQELGDQLFEEAVVLAVRAEETRVEHGIRISDGRR